MNTHYLANLRKAARAELLDYAPANDWAEAALAVAREHRVPGETAEAAYARLSVMPGHEVAALDKMRRLARDARGRKAPELSPPPMTKAQRDAQAELFELSKRAAAESGQSFEQAFARIAATPEGAALWARWRA